MEMAQGKGSLVPLYLRHGLIGFLLFAVACQSALPRRLAQRPLSLPAGENRVDLEVGASADLGGSGFQVLGAGGIYARGLSDRWELGLPLVLRHRLGDEILQWRLQGGLFGVGFSSTPTRRVDDLQDPRQPPRFGGQWVLAPGLGADLRWAFASDWAVVAGVSGRLDLDFIDVRPGGFGLYAQLQRSLLDELSLAVSTATSYGRVLNDEPLRFLGVVSAFEVWLHLSPSVDLVLRPRVSLFNDVEALEITRVAMGGTVGMDWHFQ